MHHDLDDDLNENIEYSVELPDEDSCEAVADEHESFAESDEVYDEGDQKERLYFNKPSHLHHHHQRRWDYFPECGSSSDDKDEESKTVEFTGDYLTRRPY